jgi:hypothetical protein
MGIKIHLAGVQQKALPSAAASGHDRLKKEQAALRRVSKPKAR